MNHTFLKSGLRALLGCALLSTAALADGDPNTLTNPSFEDPDPVFPFVPLGWGDIPLDNPIWTDAYARTGTMSIGLPPASLGSFTGWTTNIFDENGDLFDPPYVYLGGDLVVSGYYNIPPGEELNPNPAEPPLDLVAIKLELRRVPPNFSVYMAWEFPITVSTTNGEWVYFEAVVTNAMVEDWPDKPESVSILPFRFNLGAGWQGTIYWDDLCVTQLTDPPCPADLTGDGVLDVFDVFLFLADYDNGACTGPAGDFNGDGNCDAFDVFEFLSAYDNGNGCS